MKFDMIPTRDGCMISIFKSEDIFNTVIVIDSNGVWRWKSMHPMEELDTDNRGSVKVIGVDKIW